MTEPTGKPGVSRRNLLGGGLLVAGAAGASAVWAAETDSSRPSLRGELSALIPQHSLRTWDVGQIGDSITVADVTPGLANSTGAGSCVFGALSYLGAALPLTGGRFRFGGNWATGGFTSRQIRDQHLPSALAARPAVCVVLAGTNDIVRLTLAQSQDNIIAMVTALQRAGTLPLMATIPPVNGLIGPGLRRLTAFNIWLRRTARQLGLPLADFHSALADPGSGQYRSGYANAVDGIHPSALGAAAMGVELARVLDAIPGAAPAPLLDSYTPEGALLADVCQTGSGTWSLAGSVAAARYAQIAGAGWRGNKGVLVSQGTPAYYLVGALHSRPVAGHRIQLGFVVDASAVPAGGTWSCLLADSVSRVAVCGYAQCSQPLTNAAGNPISLWEFDMPESKPGSNFVFTYSVQGAVGVSLGCAQVSLVDLTALGVA